MNLSKRYSQLIEYMNEEGSKFTNAALKLGTPIWLTSLPTCAVKYEPKNKKGFEFLLLQKIGAAVD